MTIKKPIVKTLRKSVIRGVVHLLSYLISVVLYRDTKKGVKSQSIKTIVLFQIDNFGDIVMSLPVIQALRRMFPSACLSMVVHPNAEEFVERFCDRIFTYESKLTYKNADRKISFVYPLKKAIELRREKYDLIVDLRSDFMTLIFALLRGGRYRVDISSERLIPTMRKFWCILQGRIYKAENPIHETDLRLKVLNKLGLEAGKYAFPFAMIVATDKETYHVSEMLKALGILDKLKVVIHPGAAWKYRMWQPSNISRLADRLISELDAEVLLTGSHGERELVDNIQADMENKPVNLAGKTSIGELSALMQLCQLIIAPDSLAAHLAAAVKTPVIVLFGPQNPRLFAPKGDNVVVIRKDIACSPCRQDVCLYPQDNCMSLISVNDVFTTACRILDGKICCGKKKK